MKYSEVFDEIIRRVDQLADELVKLASITGDYRTRRVNRAEVLKSLSSELKEMKNEDYLSINEVKSEIKEKLHKFGDKSTKGWIGPKFTNRFGELNRGNHIRRFFDGVPCVPQALQYKEPSIYEILDAIIVKKQKQSKNQNSSALFIHQLVQEKSNKKNVELGNVTENTL
ncbi:hypothetical protein [Piscirickettsia salmonis]|uniref:hypothetical protein n=1 Tax=Piscirickettsia salmonis TaxID=1238 RepID=UPI0007C96ABA|nr:hypothetical protein A0O36_00340 [Piscirickettsiaceae bacterium NZ-RLO1]